MPRRIPPHLFTDFSITEPYANEVDYLKQQSITAGCNPSPLQYCPDTSFQRQQMAVYIVTSLLLAQGQLTSGFSYTLTPYFNDVPPTITVVGPPPGYVMTTVANPYFQYVQRLKDLGITSGCSVSPPLFCPTSNVTNGQMAVFTIAAWEQISGNSLGTWTTTPYYVDVPSGDPFFLFIQKATDLNIFKPYNLCGTNMFCPDTHDITRGQAAIDMVRGILRVLNWSITSTTLTDLQTCIGSSGNPNSGTCILSPTSYSVYASPGPLTIARSGITIKGGGAPGDTILVRGDSSIGAIMIPSSTSITNVTIENLTFDGNRYGAGLGLNCLAGNNSYSDLDLDFGGPAQGTFTVQWVDFINAPGDALKLGGGSTVSLSNFGQGGSVTATRSTAIYIEGSANGAWYNAVSYAGTATITLNGAGQYAYGNLLIQNRYEMSDISLSGALQQGGQLVLTPTSTNGSVAGNVINGSNWPMGPGGPGTGPPYNPPDTGCTLGSGYAYNPGIEALGIGHGFYNNEVYQNTGAGMTLAATKSTLELTGQIYISSSNPWDSSDTTRLIEKNAHGGIDFCGPAENPSGCVSPAVGVVLDDVLVENNAGYGVSLSNVSNYFGSTNYLGFINAVGYRSACLTGNSGVSGDPNHDTNTHVLTTLTYSVPLNDADFHGNPCPTSGGTTPALSHIPGWNW